MQVSTECAAALLSFRYPSIIINFKLFFPPLSSLFLTFQEVDMTALQFAGPSFPLSSSYHPSYYFLPSNPSSSYTYPNSILRLTQLFDSLPVPQYLFFLFFNLYILFNPILIRISVIITFC